MPELMKNFFRLLSFIYHVYRNFRKKIAKKKSKFALSIKYNYLYLFQQTLKHRKHESNESNYQERSRDHQASNSLG